jgi:hypothetical protein
VTKENEEDGKTPLPKEEKCSMKGCYIHSPSKNIEPGDVVRVCDRSLLMNVRTKEEKDASHGEVRTTVRVCPYCQMNWEMPNDMQINKCPNCR